MDRFSEASAWSSGWEYQQVSWLSSLSNATIRREPFSAVLVMCRYLTGIPEKKKLSSILKKTAI